MRLRIFFIYFSIIIFKSLTSPIENDEESNLDSEDYDDDENKSKIENFVGTNLFETESMCSDICLSTENVGLLASRKEFENLLPKSLPKTLMDDELIMSLMQYFYGAKQVIIRMSTGKSKDLSEKAFYDTLGGYLQWYVIPVVKKSFYAGLVCLKIAKNVMEVYRQCKIFLNTNGNGWIAPNNDFSDFEIVIQPLHFLCEPEESACMHLELSDDKENDDYMLVPLPKLEREEKGQLSNIWLPFKRKKSFNLRSYHSAFIFLKYFEMVTKCYKYENEVQDNFNKKLKEWIQENIEIHLEDEIFYPGLGAVLRIHETLKHKPKKRISKKEVDQMEDEETVDIDLLHAAIKPPTTNTEIGRKDFLNELFGKFASKDVARSGEYEDDEYADEDKNFKNSPIESKYHREKYLMALWISLAFLLFFCICCIPLMIIWHRRDRIFDNPEDSNRHVSIRHKTSGDDCDNDKSYRGSPPKDDRQSKRKDKDDKKKKEERPKDNLKEYKYCEDYCDKHKTDKKSGRNKKYESPKKKTYDNLSMNGTEIISTSSQSFDNGKCNKPLSYPFVPARRTRNATESPMKPPNDKKFSISRKGRVPSNDPLAQRLALARGVSKVFF